MKRSSAALLVLVAWAAGLAALALLVAQRLHVDSDLRLFLPAPATPEQRLLLDTHAVVWSLLDLGRLSSRARAAIESPVATIHVSVASVWEIAIKVRLDVESRRREVMGEDVGAAEGVLEVTEFWVSRP